MGGQDKGRNIVKLICASNCDNTLGKGLKSLRYILEPYITVQQRQKMFFLVKKLMSWMEGHYVIIA